VVEAVGATGSPRRSVLYGRRGPASGAVGPWGPGSVLWGSEAAGSASEAGCRGAELREPRSRGAGESWSSAVAVAWHRRRGRGHGQGGPALRAWRR